MEWLVAPPNILRFYFSANGRNTINRTGEQSGCFGLQAADFKTLWSTVSFYHPTSQTATGRKRVRIRAMLIQLGLWLIWTNRTLAGRTTCNQRLLCLQRSVSTTSSRIKLLHSMGGPCFEPTESRTTAGRGEVATTTMSSPSFCHCLHSPWHKMPYMFMYICI